jgi:putative transcriptional regulator
MKPEHKLYEITPRLGEILRDRKMTQSSLAEKSMIPQAAISRFDKSASHSDIHLIAISRALDIQIEELFHVKVKPQEANK